METQINEAVFGNYLVHKVDIRRCPKCDYHGFFNMHKYCENELHCEKCNSTWVDADLFAYYNTSVAATILGKLVFDLRKVLFTEPCPECGILIDKNGGCNSIICGRCKLQFCWSCLSDYSGY